MLITHGREKLINSIIFFAENVKFCGKVKLFKLLYFLDFEHYRVTGRSVTGMEYFAWKMGPVPVDLDSEINSPQEDMAKAVNFVSTSIRGGSQKMLQPKPVVKFDGKHFSKRELKLMEELATEYRDTVSADMVEATHLENLPWDKIYNKQNTPKALIPYELAFRAQEAELMKRKALEHKELVEKLK